MDAEPDVIREDIEQTRSALAEKLETLESQVRETVQDAKEKVEETIENVTSTVQDTVESVQQTFDLNYQMQRRPWTLMAGSVAAGFLVAFLVNRSQRPRYDGAEQDRSAGYGYGPSSASAAAQTVERTATAFRPPESQPPASEPPRPGLLSGLAERFEPEINMAKEMAIGFAAGLVRDMLKEAVPALGNQVQRMMDSATTKLGGKPVEGPVTEGLKPEESHGYQGAPGGRATY